MSRLRIDWSAVRWVEPTSRDTWLVLRMEWAGRADATQSAPLLFFRAAAPECETTMVAMVVAGAEGMICPTLPEGRFVVPGPALSAPFYLFIPTDSAPDEPFFVQVVLAVTADGDDEVEEFEVDLAQAWPKAPAPWSDDLATAKRLLDTGGAPGERAAYVRLVTQALARVEHPQVATLRMSLDSAEAIAELPVDMRPLARPGAILDLAHAAEVGDVEGVRRGLAALPEPLRAAPSLASLIEVAVAAAARPGAPERRLLAEAARARDESQFSRAVELYDQIPPGNEWYDTARTERLHAVADAIEDALRRRDREAAEQWVQAERATLEREIGADDPWLLSVLHVLGQPAGVDLEEAEVVGLLPAERINTAARAVWSRMRSWLKPRSPWEE